MLENTKDTASPVDEPEDLTKEIMVTIRYEPDVMLALKESPLVEKPEGMVLDYVQYHAHIHSGVNSTRASVAGAKQYDIPEQQLHQDDDEEEEGFKVVVKKVPSGVIYIIF